MNAVMKNDDRLIAELIASHKPGHSLDQRFYTDPAIYDLEIEKIVNRNWILAGHASQLPELGDFKVLNVGQESAIIVRGKDGNLKGFANVCRHRGSLVCLEQEGHVGPDSRAQRVRRGMHGDAAQRSRCSLAPARDTGSRTPSRPRL